MNSIKQLLVISTLFPIAAHAATHVVLNAGDSGAGSLRQTISDSGPGDTITFAPGLSGQAITLASQLSIGKNLTIDGSSLADGIVIAGGISHRVFEITAGQTVTLTALTLTGGSSDLGGGIYNEGALTVNRSTISGFARSVAGGGIFNLGTLTVNQSTISGKLADVGGGIYNLGNLTVVQCTLSGNFSGSYGGGIANEGLLTLTASIVAGNTASFAVDISGSFSSTHSLTSGNPLLSPLGNFGGPTRTMAPLPGSPARNAATGSPIISDQRGFPIVGTPDIGAYEAGTLTNYLNFIWESLPTAGNGQLTDPLHAKTYDFDGDRQNNEDEWVARTDPADFSSYFHITQSSRAGGNFSVIFPSVAGRSYRLQASPDLANPWSNVGNATAGTGNPVTLSAPVAGFPRRFFRVSVGDP